MTSLDNNIMEKEQRIKTIENGGNKCSWFEMIIYLRIDW